MLYGCSGRSKSVWLRLAWLGRLGRVQNYFRVRATRMHVTASAHLCVHRESEYLGKMGAGGVFK